VLLAYRLVVVVVVVPWAGGVCRRAAKVYEQPTFWLVGWL
jgi:hypothetical protein